MEPQSYRIRKLLFQEQLQLLLELSYSLSDRLGVRTLRVSELLVIKPQALAG